MSRTVSTNALRAMLAQETGEVFLLCVTISHPSFTAPYRLVYDQNPLVRTAGTFEPFAFALNLPNEQDDSPPVVQMAIDNINNAILKAVRNLPAGIRPDIVLEVVLASSPNVVEKGPYDFKFLSTDYDEASLTGTIGFEDDILNTAIPGSNYTPTNSRGLFL
jgi:hypothetical protein